MENILSLEMINNVSEIDIVYKKKTSCKMSERPIIRESGDAYKICLHYWDLDKIELLEQFKVLMLNRANRVLYVLPLSQGGITGTVIDPRLVLAPAIKLAACFLILVHNHPSGNLKPSKADEELTIKIREAARLFDIRVLEHLIINSETYFSFADEGLL